MTTRPTMPDPHLNPIQDLRAQRNHAAYILDTLTDFQAQLPTPDPFITRQIAALEASLDRTSLPEHYRVAVVGSFKVGKSSFINKVCDLGNLASVSTNPETATITSFRYDTAARAEVHFLSRATWTRMAAIHSEDPSDPQARRYQRFYEKVVSQHQRDEVAREAGKEVQERDHDALLAEYVTDENRPIVLRCDDWNDRKQRKAFAAQVKKYVSSRDPLHCLVERVEIFAPIPLISEGIELIDTPGLDDTDAYRVQATEREVNDVDAILFLTHSGRSYSQSDKDFIITQVRKRRLRSLKMAITKIDVTYDAAVRQAQEDEEDIPTLAEHKQEELERIRSALNETLDEILRKSELTPEESQYFTRMLGDVDIFFTSSHWHDLGIEVDEKIRNRQRSGIPELQQVLAKMFQNADIVQEARASIGDAISLLLKQIEAYIQQQRTLEQDLEQEKKVESELIHTQQLVTARLKTFARKIDLRLENSRMLDQLDQDFVNTRIRQISVYVQDIINQFEQEDLIRHWRERREGGWLYLSRFSQLVANRTFAAFESLIQRFQEPMLKAAQTTERHVDAFVEDLATLSKEHELFRHDTIELVDAIRSRLRVDRSVLREIIESEQQRISERIEDFMDDRMQQRIDEARQSVTLASGRGTTVMQNDEVRRFYDEFADIVRPGFEQYLHGQFQHYLDIVAERLSGVYKSLNQEIEIRLDEQRSLVSEILSNQERGNGMVMRTAINALELRLAEHPPLLAPAAPTPTAATLNRPHRVRA
ncbi:dynamin family protein [Deinococcus soli (ex Cha et al. 2016)]|uniref:tRNA U34 5-carboxymethylaminomethyl modifying GTPase MnmE/TrmE n=2 Tax=Deinococcus soli (ex Cha et al. 2016) TaxID=1309411 RepID=A0ACC6KI62_9DEIO|nr:dynamin family protein [Deinococcus soli (ex Cha et al. 2016)]MDR6219231.1 tRNA U34 5-carboxymethylaminomethyl modifying GTPase MnmE/TrmE [Deinococcus soli (ex Cha et al. 2016)]MDR6329480.1 tRNA U34 5-carboxymethylaminomethyl modifying GTPase MnmE/TrmE [Deinococcus soli (ex Cha et al. 2016)]MDR6752140.1 tRNA U34 5-carboxymethylaminomethyl modifying GTPase MnmE/TrmE [Deinococcus soli (ex Cha et al. 2016)]